MPQISAFFTLFARMDLKKQALRNQLLRLGALSNATAAMTDKVNEILIRRMKSEKSERMMKSQNGNSDARVINWKIENQGKQTIIIL
jgi:hypothetical protein